MQVAKRAARDVELGIEPVTGEVQTFGMLVSVAHDEWCCLSGYSTAYLSRFFVTPPARSLALRDRLRGRHALRTQRT